MKKTIFTILNIVLAAVSLFSNPADSTEISKGTKTGTGNALVQKLDQLWASDEIAKLGESFKGGMQWAGCFADDKDLLVYLILGLSSILLALRIFRNKQPEGVLEGFWHTLNWILFLTVAVLEIVYVMALGSDSLWFCKPGTVGWMWTIINFLIFGFLVFNQFMSFFFILEDIQYNAGITFNWKLGIYSWPIALIAALVFAFVYQPGILIVGGLFFIAQFIQVVIIVKNMVFNGGVLPAILAVAVYLIGSIATVAILIHFFVLLLIVLVGFALISLLGSNKTQRRCPDCGKVLSEYNVCESCNVQWSFREQKK